MPIGFIAQTSIAQRPGFAFAGMLATSAPWHIAHGLNTTRQVVTVTPVASNNATYTITITQQNASVAYPFTADADATVAEIVAGLVALINAGTQGVTATNSTTHVTLTADQYTPDFSFTVATAASAGSLTAATTTAQAEGLQDGKYVVFDSTISSDPMAIRLPTTSDEVTTSTLAAGILLADSISAVRLGNFSYAPGMHGVARKGHVYVQVEETVSDNAPVYVRYAAGGLGRGSFGAGAGTSERALVNGAVYRKGASAGGFAMVEINIIGG